MKVWLTLWIAAGLIEAMSYILVTGVLAHRRHVRRIVVVLAALTVLIPSTALLVHDWQIWILPWLLGLYRVVNAGRAYLGRLHLSRLRTVSLRAWSWLYVMQLLAAGIAWWIVSGQHGLGALITLACTQLFVSLALLRTTLDTWRNTDWRHSSPTPLTDKELPTLSVLVPARNETDELEACLTALVGSDYPKLEVIVLDDCSSNPRTPEIIRQFAHDGVRFVQGQDVDSSWLAKNYAYQRLSEEATGEIMLFCGVDVLVERQSLRRLVELMMSEKREMLSVLPLRLPEEKRKFSLLQPMRYYWEVCFPRRLFKRPPVLSTCWLITRKFLEEHGSFKAVSHAITPEAHLAKRAVVSNNYIFVRSTAELPLYSTKSIDAQYSTMIRVRYPQLHRRLEMVAIASLFEATFLLGPFVGLLASPSLPYTGAMMMIWTMAVLAIVSMYSLVAIQTRLNQPLIGFLTAPLAFIVDLVMLHNSMWKYEFGEVIWKGRNVCLPVMHIEPHLPPLPSEPKIRK